MFDVADLSPHGFCLAWEPGLLWLHAGSDLLIAAAYYSIPFALLRLTQLRSDLAFPWMFRLFAGFILACGTTHVLATVTLWVPAYWTEGLAKAATAILSVTTAAILWSLLPRALAIPTQGQLERLNARLLAEIEERRTAQARLLASEARLKSIYSRSPAPLCTADRQGRLVEVSDQWLELLGYHRHEITGRALESFHRPETCEAARQEWETLLRTGSLREIEQTLIHQDGSPRRVLTSARLEADGVDGSALVISAMTDITERRKTEEALLASEASLRQAQKMEAVGHLTGGIAHDFNNILTSIMVVMELLHRRIPENDPSRQLISRVLDVSTRGAKLTGQLLAFSRRQRLVAEPLDPIDVAENMRLLLTQPLSQQVDLTIRRADGEGWLCMADRSQLEAALLNLVLNARAAIETRGQIIIEAEAIGEAMAAQIKPDADDGLLLTRDYVGIKVSDTGSGMSDDVRRRAFEPFFTTKPVGQGSGLGLSQIYGFARQSGGTVLIESTQGAGTGVTIVLPRSTHAPVMVVAEPERAPKLGRGERVLVVEDEDTLRDVVVASLREHGYDVISASMADEALRVLHEVENVDVLFTDVVMPGGKTGVDLAIEVRKRLPGLPVVFATGYTDRRILDQWPDTLRLVPKPYSVEAISAVIQNALSDRDLNKPGLAISQSAASAT